MVGCSAFTHEKWERFDYLLGIHIEICKAIISRERWASGAYHYFDFYAGPGIYGPDESEKLTGQYGSPIRALKQLRQKEVAFHLYCFDFDPEIATRLERVLRGDYGLDWGCSPSACDESVDLLLGDLWWSLNHNDSRKPLGLAFFDPNGIPEWTAAKRFARSKRFDRVDLLFNINSAVCKWVFSSRLHPETKRPTDHLREMKKKSIYLWTPMPGDSHQFALAYCTNGPFPQFRQWGFHRIDTPEGARISRMIDFSPRERRDMGGTTRYFDFGGPNGT